MIERCLAKRRILELYLNEIEWGDGIYGAEAAAQHYFHKPASTLSANEAAFLAAMIPNPRTVFNPQVNPRRVARRQRIILRRSLIQGQQHLEKFTSEWATASTSQNTMPP